MAALLCLLLGAKCAGGIPPYAPASTHVDPAGVIYLHAPDRQAVFRWDGEAGRYLSKIPLAVGSVHLAYSRVHHVLYVAYPDRITRIDLSGTLAEEPLVDLQEYPRDLLVTGPSVLAPGISALWVFADDGSLVLHKPVGFRSDTGYAWSDTASGIFLVTDNINPARLWRYSFDPTTGEILGGAGGASTTDHHLANPVWVSEDATLLLLATGHFWDANTLEIRDPLPVVPVDAVWTPDGGVITLSDTGDGRTRLDQWDVDRNLFNRMYYEGSPVRIHATAGGYAVVTQPGQRPAFHHYAPTDDPDGDGVANPDDRFPLDPAASADVDGDGFPGSWNPGSGPGDSTTGLELDAFPGDSACWLASHGTGGTCDPSDHLPAYVPTHVIVDDADIVYLLSPENARIYRWSPATGDDLNPIVTGEDPVAMAYSAATHRLYLAYPDRRITEIDLADPHRERPFASTFGAPHGLATAGPYLMGAGVSRWWEFYTFDPAGTRLSWTRGDFSREYAWSPALGRMYYFRDNWSPQSLAWTDIDAAGILGSQGDSSIGSFPTTLPIRPSPSGDRVLVGQGTLYATATHTIAESLPVDISDALWLGPDLLTLRPTSAGDTRIEHWDAALAPITEFQFPGAPIRVLGWSGGVLVLTDDGGPPRIHPYAVGADPDGDGVPSPIDDLPLDPAASIDSDFDGYPDAWNPGAGPGDSTTGLTLDAFPDHAACWLAQHGVGGVCDVTVTLPAYDPAAIRMDRDGVVHLLSPDHSRIYRWSSAGERHLDPLVLREPATHMAYDGDSHWLYVSGDSGAIYRVDPSGNTREQFVAATWGPALGLATAGEYILAADETDYNSHYTFDSAGSLLSRSRFNERSSSYAWNPVNRRMYFFRDTTSPNDLHWEEIDAQGFIVAEGESRYHGHYPIAPPIRVEGNGDRVVLGTGVVYDANTLEVVHTLPEGLADALWAADGRFLGVRSDGAGATVVDQRGTDLVFWGSVTFPGEPRRALEWSGGYVIVTWVAGHPTFHSYAPSDDSDGDGVDNFADAFPDDFAAAVDTDGDGSPDAWNPGAGPGDSTTGLELDSFPFDFACQLPAHGVGGVCDFSLVVPPDPGEGLCTSDDVGAMPDSGFLATPEAADFVALCSGWILYADLPNKRVIAKHVESGRIGLSATLPGEPYHLELDEDAKVVYVSIPYDWTVAEVDLLTGAVAHFDVPAGPYHLALGNGGDLFIWANNTIYRLAGGAATVDGGWYLRSSVIRFNRARNELLAASSGYLERHAYDAATGFTELESTRLYQAPPHELALSADGARIAYANDAYSSPLVPELSAASLGTRFGSYDVGLYPRGLAYSRDGSRFAASTAGLLRVFDTGSHGLVGSLSVAACPYGQVREVDLSRGGSLAFVRQSCGSLDQTSEIHWLRVD